MAKLPLIARDTRGGTHEDPIPPDQLPFFYMNDFSRIGLRVDSCEAAERVLAKSAFALVRDEGGLRVNVQGAAGVKDLIDLLMSQGVGCEMADVAERLYQG